MKDDQFHQQNELYYATNRYLNSDQEDWKTAQEISRGYQTLWRPFKNVPTAPQTIELSRYERNPTFNREFSIIAPFVKHFIVHGSFATDDMAPGFSDLDTFVILKKEVCLSPHKLSQLRRKVSPLKKLLLEIDPLAHHGLIFCNEQNLDYYPQHYLPITVFRYAKSLYGPEKIQFKVRNSAREAKENFYHYYKIFQNIAKTGVIKNKPGSGLYQLKWFVSMLLLMPSLYLQTKDIYLYKKYSFDFVRHPFLDKLQRTRKNFRNVKRILGKNYLKEGFAMLKTWHKELVMQKDKKNINPPKKLPLSLYHKTKEKIIKELQGNPDIVAIYEYGLTSTPGISDIDLIIVTKNRLKNSRPKDYEVDFGKIARGTPMIMPEVVFADIQYFDPVILKKLYGKNVKIKNPSKNTLQQRNIASIIDWLPERTLRLIAILKKGAIDIQYSLRYAKSFAYSLDLISNLLKDPYYKTFGKEINALRKEVLRYSASRLLNSHSSKFIKGERTSDIQKLLLLLKRGIYMSYEALNQFSEKYLKKWPAIEGWITLFEGQEIVFTNGPKGKDPEWSLAHSDQKLARIFIDSKFASHFAFYAEQSGLLSKQMEKQSSLREIDSNRSNLAGSLPKNYKNFLKKKMAIATANAKFLKKYGFKAGLFRFGFYY